jgi:hypothetical protein
MSTVLIQNNTAAVEAPPQAPPSYQWEAWVTYAAQLFLIMWLCSSLIYGLTAALWFSGAAADGPFLVFNGLRRIAAGQIGGRDFVDIHGIALPYLHYLLFAAFGANSINASELSRQWTSITLFLLSLWAFARATLGRSSRVWIGMSLSIMFLEIVFPRDVVGTPGNLDAWVRSTMPIFAFALLQVQLRDWLKAVLTGGSIALAFVFGTEHGIGVALALLAVLGLSLVQSLTNRGARTTFFDNLRFSAISLVSAAASVAAVLISLCGLKGAFRAVYFNLVEMPTDQIWFFGGPPMPFVGAWKDFFSRHTILILLPTYIALLVLASIVIRFWKAPLRIGRDWRALAAIMLLYGIASVVPLLAILSRHYVFPLVRVVTLVALLLCANLILPRLHEFSSMFQVRRWSTFFAMLCIVSSLGLAAAATRRTIALVGHLRAESPVYSRLLDDHWNAFMTETTRLIDSQRQRKDLSIWSAYAGLLESHYGIFHPAQDYIIHASYGPQRWHRYLEKFRDVNAEFVTTMTPEFGFEEWLQDERWGFYEALVDNYQPLQRIQHTTVWQRKAGPWRMPSQNFQSIPREPHSDSYALPIATGSDRLGVVRVRYTITNPWAWIPLVGKTPRYLATIEGSPRRLPVSFPPYLSEFEFPVQLPPGHAVRLRFTTVSVLPGVLFRIDEVQTKVLDLDASQRAVFVFTPKARPQTLSFPRPHSIS